MFSTLALAITGLWLVHGAQAYWRMPCGIIQTGRIDPLVNPGTVAGHVHKISGPPSISPNSDYDSLQDNRCTSCAVQGDKSAYWTPLLYYQHSNGSFEEVPANGMLAYYLGRGENASYIQPFPKGFKMLSGNPFVRAYDNTTYTYGGTQGVIYTGGHCQTGDQKCTGGQFVPRNGTNDPPGPVFLGRPVSDRVSFNCLDASPIPETPSIQRTNCSNGLRAQIQFPSCWNGVDLYKTDQSHVDYLSQIDNGVCPPTHPILLPHLFYEVLYTTSSITVDGGQFVFANGDPTGFGFHGDFLNGWDEDLLQQAIDQCVNVDNGGDVDQCAPFRASLDYNAGYNCPPQPAYFDEAVHGMIGTKLPGCNQVVAGPAPATPKDLTCPANTTSPTMNTTYHFGGGTAPTNPAIGVVQNGFIYLGCFNDDSAHSFSVASTSGNTTTNAACQSFCTSKGLPIAATEYGSQCFCGYNFNSTINYNKTCNSMICSGNSSEYCGSGSTLNAWNSTSYTGLYNPVLPEDGTDIGNGIEYLGCASDSVTSRALNVVSTTNTTNMTNAFCADFCAGQNLQYFGTEYGTECHCGNEFIGGAVLGQQGCSMQCSGLPPSSGIFSKWANICGGSNRLTAWNNTRISAGNNNQATSSQSSTTSANIASATPASTTASSSPVQPTQGNPIGYNGQYVYLGCASELGNGRALNVTSTKNSTGMNNDMCAKYCASKGLPIFGTEYSSECYCGNSLADGSKLGQTGCNMPCAGSTNASSPFAAYANTCGGQSRLSIYNNTAIPAVHNSNNIKLGNSSWAYKGCYQDTTGSRLLSGPSWSASQGINTTSCLGYCQGKGFGVAGMEYGAECYCSKNLPDAALPADEWTCNMQCNGDSSAWCGGSNRISVFSTGG